MTDALLLREQDRQELVRLLARYLPDAAAWAYGSRVNGGAHEGSDLDIVLRSPDLSPIPLEELRAFVQALRDSNIPILVEARDWARLPESFQQEIMKKYVVMRETVSEWMEVKLNDIIEIIGGGTPKTSISEYWNGEIPWLSVADFNTGRKFVSTAEKYITDEGLNNSSSRLLHAGDVIISARGTVGVVAVLEKNMAFNQSCYGIKGIKGISETDYIYYLLRDTVENFLQIAHGGVFDTITRETFKEILRFLPPLHEQKAIASVLSSLDDKIDLLHRQNKTLEAMAEALFRQWFVEEAGEDWEEKSLYDCIKLIGGGTPKTSVDEYWNGDICWISAKDITPNHKGVICSTEKKITTEGLTNSSTRILPQFSTIISARGTVGKYALLLDDMAFSQSNYGIIPKYKDCYFFTYFLVANVVDDLVSAAYGSVFDTITTKTFKEQYVTVPLEEEIIGFEKEISPLFLKVLNNSKQIRTLEKLRDTLLPKLMSGEVRVAC